MVASHNEESIIKAVRRMGELRLLSRDGIYYAQLQGMCDHVSFALGQVLLCCCVRPAFARRDSSHACGVSVRVACQGAASVGLGLGFKGAYALDGGAQQARVMTELKVDVPRV